MTKKKYYFISLLLVLVFVAPLFKMEYATDTYSLAVSGLKLAGDHMLNNNGRIITALFFYLFDALSLGVVPFYYFSFILSVVCASFAIYRLYKIFSSDLNKIFALFFATMIVLNPLATEYFLFIEKGFFFFAILMAVLSFEGLVLFLNGNKIGFILAFPTILLSAFTYQVIPGLFFILSISFLLIKFKSIKNFFFNSFISTMIYGFGVGGNYILLKCLSTSSRVGGGFSISNLFKAIFILDFYTLFIYIGVLLIIFLTCLAVNKIKFKRFFTKALLSNLASCVLILFGGFIVTFAPFAFVAEGEVWITFRIVYPLGALLIAIPYFFCSKYGFSIIDLKKKATKASIVIISAILLINFAFFQTMFISRQINNYKDEQLCQQISEEINRYEKESGNEIKKIKIYYDSKITSRNSWVLKIGDCNVRAFSKDWSDVNHMIFILDKQLTKQAPDKHYVNYFSSKNWDNYDKEQLIFDVDTLHICVY